MAKSRLKLNNKGFRELRTNPKVGADLLRRAQDIADAAGDGYEAVQNPNPRNRYRAAVVPVTADAAIDNARHNTLLRAMRAGRYDA